jgi:glycosyltransferase involved in cell wall biosynthesis
MRILHIGKGGSSPLLDTNPAVSGLAEASVRAGFQVALLTVDGRLPELPETADSPAAGSSMPDPRAQERQAEARNSVDREVVCRHFSRHQAMTSGIDFAIRWQPDIVHLHNAHFKALALGVRQATGAAIVYSIHLPHRITLDLFGGRPSKALEAQEAALPVAQRLIALTRDARDRLAGYYPEVASRIRIVGNAVNDSEEAEEIAQGRRLRVPPTVLFCGRFAALKGIDTLLAAVPRILDRAQEVRFVVIGGARDDAEVTRHEADRWREETPERYHAAVQFTGWLDRRQIVSWYRAADILVVPSSYDTFPMVVLEGMLFGMAIAATAVGGPQEILEHEKNALLFPPRDADALASTLLRLVQDPDRCQRLGAAAAAEVRSRWLWPQIAPKMHDIYRELLESGAGS